ncbi:MAG: alanine racemase [Microbacterium sp. 71-36]|uniref:alanine racemase C-terminal domain-containing protein n=1 Tax=unclassified Microbacterium TaxID=2609290 RepID=UPI000929FED1|nr:MULTISPECIES: alanine racemase C-terminal domain-containing protein [unclassified Microbacterium]MBN9210692.1 alanine racemase [Microbacterium sp.]OJV76973.1 MAG: alanine racemase [Microbacterium sp. 71-36]
MTSDAAIFTAPDAAGGVSPVARVSERNLRANARLASTGRADDVLAADAWGHGADWVASVLASLGTDPAGLDAATLFGLPGGDPRSRPVLSLHGRVLGTKALLTGEGVSYGYTHRAARDTTVALVTGGYAQGVVRSLGNAADVAIDGRRHRIIGRVAMDVCVVDVDDARPVRGSGVVFFGDPAAGHPALGEWTDATGWNAGEIVAAVGARAVRTVVA